jgi:PKHD-type hydroxylase
MIFTEPKWKSYIVTSKTPVFTPAQCEDIIRVGKSSPQEDAATGDGGKGKKDYKVRKTDIAWIPFNRMPEMYKTLEMWGTKVNNNHFGFDGIQIGEMAQFTQYSQRHHYDWHSDSPYVFSNEPPVRKLTMVTMLSNPKDFKGGELQIIDNKQTLSLKQGYAIFFASFIAHRVLPIKKGTRISMPIWFTGPSLK